MNRRTKIIFIAALITLCIALALLLFSRMDRDNITSQQAKNIAYGIALKNCIELKDSKLDCGRLVLTNPVLNCGEWYCKDAPYWSIDYSIGDSSGTVYLDLVGNQVNESDLSSL